MDAEHLDRWFKAVPIENSEGVLFGGVFEEIDEPQGSPTLARERSEFEDGAKTPE